MPENQFQPIFDYIDKSKEETLEVLRTEFRTEIGKVLGAVGDVAKNYKDTDDKVTIQESKTEKMEHWVMQAAEKTQVPYNP